MLSPFHLQMLFKYQTYGVMRNGLQRKICGFRGAIKAISGWSCCSECMRALRRAPHGEFPSLWLSLAMATAAPMGPRPWRWRTSPAAAERVGDHWRDIFDYVGARLSAYAADLDIATAMVIGEDLFPTCTREFRAFL